MTHDELTNVHILDLNHDTMCTYLPPHEGEYGLECDVAASVLRGQYSTKYMGPVTNIELCEKCVEQYFKWLRRLLSNDAQGWVFTKTKLGLVATNIYVQSTSEESE